jgi:hypothetical protein
MTNNKQRFKFTKYEGKPEWDRIDIQQELSQWSIRGYSDGDVGIECAFLGTETLFLNQDELKQVIEFLQSKLLSNDKQ